MRPLTRQRRATDRRCSRLWSLALLGVLLTSPLLAQPREVASAGARAAQFVFVIDDSGSMEETDPDRLAVFAVRSLLGMLDDRDEATVVRLNGPRDGAPPPPIEPLRQNRAELERLLDLGGPIAAYASDYTPCRSALAAVERLLRAAYRPDTAQVVFFLTDGECTPAAEEQPSPGTFLNELPSYADGLFQLYGLRFRGKSFSPELGQIARQTGGSVIEADANQPTSLLDGFARALSRSQGYSSHLLDPDERRLPAHRGAERVRLLAVAPGPGSELAFSITDGRGRSPERLGAARTGIHRYGDGRVFRFTALDYRPDIAPVEVAVEGAGDDWKVVALPEYRLSLDLSMYQGRCGEAGEEAEYGVDTGSTICAVAQLVGGDGQPVEDAGDERDLDVQLLVRFFGSEGAKATEPATEPVPINARALGGGRYSFERADLDTGDYELQARATLAIERGQGQRGDELVFLSPPRSLQVSSLVVDPVPARLELGTLEPGESVSESITFTGVFPPSRAWIELRDRGEIPACLHARLSGVAEGPPRGDEETGGLEILVDQSYTLTLTMAPYCGPESFEREISTALRLVFDPASSTRRLPVVEVPISLGLSYRIAVPDEIVLALEGGDSTEAALEIDGNFTAPGKLLARVAGPKAPETTSWPEDADLLRLDFQGGESHRAPGDSGEALAAEIVTVGSGQPLRLRARARSCCPGGDYRTVLGVNAAPDQPLPPGAPPLDWLVIPVTVQVRSDGIWACWGTRILWGFLVLLALLLLLYVINMFRQSSFLNVRVLASRLRPLVWNSHGQAVEQDKALDAVRRLLRRELTPWRRTLNWLKANPLRFGLPGRAYREALELYLQPHKDIARSRARLVPQADLMRRIEADPQRHAGRVFAIAWGGGTLVGVPDGSGRMSRMQPAESSFSTPSGEDGPRPVRLRNSQLLTPLDEWEIREDGAAAGWSLG